jgi:CheY-like chemotaxis protein
METVSVLIADDNEDVLEVINDVIHSLDKKILVDTANNGYDALSLIREKKYDLLITDFNMPILNGLHLIRSLKSVAEKFQPNSILMLSDYIEEGEAPPEIKYVTYMAKTNIGKDLINYLEERLNNINNRDKLHEDESDRISTRKVPAKGKAASIEILGFASVHLGLVRDISLTGVGVFIPHFSNDVMASSTIECMLKLPNEAAFSFTGIIKHVGSTHEFYFGIEFDEITENNRKKLEDYINSLD